MDPYSSPYMILNTNLCNPFPHSLFPSCSESPGEPKEFASLHTPPGPWPTCRKGFGHIMWRLRLITALSAVLHGILVDFAIRAVTSVISGALEDTSFCLQFPTASSLPRNVRLRVFGVAGSQHMTL